METKIVNWRIIDTSKKDIFGGSRRKDPCEIRQYTCNRTEDCPTYQQGGCITFNTFGKKCPHSKYSYEQGYTPRARKYYETLKSFKDRVEGIEQRSAPSHMTQVPGFVYFPYPHWSLDRGVPCPGNRGGMFSTQEQFIPDHMFTAEWLSEVLQARPQAVMGGEITSYQKEVVPKIIGDLKQVFPGLYQEMLEKYPDLVKGVDYVGRKAYLCTTLPHSWKEGRVRYEWSGRDINVIGWSSAFQPIKGEVVMMTIIPDSKATITITSNDQVGPDTKFV